MRKPLLSEMAPTAGPKGPATLDAALHVEHGFVQRIAQRIAGVAADHHAPGLRHGDGVAADGAAHHDVATLRGDAAAQAGIAVDH